MEIKKIGEGSFRIKSKKATGSSLIMSEGKAEINRMVDDKEEKLVFDRPGEYEVAGIGFMGIRMGEKICFVAHVDELSIAHLDGAQAELTEKQSDQVGEIDILLIEAIGDAVKIAKEINPSIVIPLGDEAAVDKFLEKLNVVKTVQDKLSLTRDDLPDEMQVIVLG